MKQHFYFLVMIISTIYSSFHAMEQQNDSCWISGTAQDSIIINDKKEKVLDLFLSNHRNIFPEPRVFVVTQHGHHNYYMPIPSLKTVSEDTLKKIRHGEWVYNPYFEIITAPQSMFVGLLLIGTCNIQIGKILIDLLAIPTN